MFGVRLQLTAWLYVQALLLSALPPLCRSDDALEKADSLVGKSVTVLNVYRSTGGVTITRLQSDRQLAAAKEALQSALKKYPASFIERVLNTVYVGADLKQVGEGERKSWGGLYRYRDKTIFLKFTGNALQFESVFHHELAHGIHLNFRSHFDEKGWLAANPPDFHYTGVIDARPASPELLQQGFVRPYAMFSIEEDIACTAEGLIGDTENFSKGVGRFDRLNRKARILAALYQSVDPVMTVSYFRLQQVEAQRDKAGDGADAADERGRPALVSAQTERGTFLGNFKEGDSITLFYRDKTQNRSKTALTFAPESPANITLCRRKKARDESALTVLTKVPRMTHEKPFTFTFKESCAAVLKMDGEAPDGTDKVRFEFQIERNGQR
jgi:hypothetical protein